MKKKNIYITFISLLVLLSFYAFNEIKRKINITKLSNVTALKIPSTARGIQYKKIYANDENLYPYFFYLKFKCQNVEYIKMINGQLFNIFDTGSAKYVLRNELFIQDSMFVYPKPKIGWWDLRNHLNYKNIFSNFFEDANINKIGLDISYNGQIRSYFDGRFCYVYIICFGHSDK